MASTINILGGMKGEVMGHPKISRVVELAVLVCLRGCSLSRQQAPGVGGREARRSSKGGGDPVSQAGLNT